jgi:hypothetical protein
MTQSYLGLPRRWRRTRRSLVIPTGDGRGPPNRGELWKGCAVSTGFPASKVEEVIRGLIAGQGTD